MKNFIFGALFIGALWYLIDWSTDESGKQGYVHDAMCAKLTGSSALKKEATRMRKILINNRVSLDQSDIESAAKHWMSVFGVASYSELFQHPEFIATCRYNACIYEGRDRETCIQDKVDACLDQGLDFGECFPD